MEIKAKFWIENKGEVVLGGGKTALLLAVDRLGFHSAGSRGIRDVVSSCLGSDQKDRTTSRI